MKFPVQKENSQSGFGVKVGVCPVCKGSLAGEPGSFAFVNGGALKRLGKRAFISPDLVGFLSLGVHGAHSDGREEASAHVSVAEGIPCGQFDFYFCSAACLRGFFNRAVDELERRLAQNARECDSRRR